MQNSLKNLEGLFESSSTYSGIEINKEYPSE